METSGFASLLWRIQRRLLELAAPCLEALDLAPKHAFLLGQLSRRQRPGEIARHLHLPAPSVSHLLAELEARGWITRRPDPDDRRRLLAELTPEGRSALAAVRRCLAAASERLLDRLDTAERDRLLALLARLEGNDA